MKRKSILQLIIILVGVFIGAYFSSRAMILHQEIEIKHVSIDQRMNHGYLDVSKDSILPTIEKIELTKDSMSGWNLSIKTTNFDFTPENVNKNHIPGKGHAHIYINDKKHARLYGSSFHISSYNEEINSIRITLNSNNHRTLKIKEKPIQKTIIIN